ncbi:MAG: DUF1800 domain-containing protein [Burkholderiales bacterium]|nr:DUF1800 domain-containing protein [Burkholderiales bacterium]
MDDHSAALTLTGDIGGPPPAPPATRRAAEAAAPATPATAPAHGLTAAAAAAALLAACGGGEEAPADTGVAAAGAGTDTRRRAQAAALAPSPRDAARWLSQASFGPRSPEEVAALQAKGFAAWLDEQMALPATGHVAYLDAERARTGKRKAPEEWSYEAVWQQWLFGPDALRARVSWALLQIFVISNIAPDIRPYAMSSYLDLLNRNAFGNYRQLLQEVTLHPAMGYYLNMLASEKENPAKGTHPNENYAREVLQLFSIGLVKLNADGSPQLGADGKPVPTYDEAVVKGFAKAFSGWSFGGRDNTVARNFHKYDANNDALWTQPMKPWAMYHDVGPKTLLDGRVLPAGQSAERDLADALDCIFHHPNVGPFIGRQLIQRLVTSNPSAAYIRRVAAVFADNGRGVRGDLAAVLRAVLLDPEVRGDDTDARPRAGKQREPVLRFAQALRALGARSSSGRNAIHYLDSPEDGLGQSPLLAPSVFNFYSPNFRPAGPLAAAGLVAPEFQITSETSIVGSLNFFAKLFSRGAYGSGATRLALDYGPLAAPAMVDGAATGLIDRLDLLFFDLQMSRATRTRLQTVIAALPGGTTSKRLNRVKAALTVVAMSPDHVIQK